MLLITFVIHEVLPWIQGLDLNVVLVVLLGGLCGLIAIFPGHEKILLDVNQSSEDKELHQLMASLWSMAVLGRQQVNR